MELPELTSPDGVLTYLLTTILVVCLVIALYLVAVYVGIAPAV
ncbi:hypothetical protein SAMN04488063_2836 [Halopelagius inordinatus]|uniref:Uncharacterized protein n=1 Tax=Halopelagius inordinatus TaxID=553467 RepID=A0A1I2U9I0_9EURY|nr:hypothetical protein [Halopelagius inordinatus]SFG73782.1 hypothetical protein SAMN04488063_2836 [Halopelagius inordinatus]